MVDRTDQRHPRRRRIQRHRLPRQLDRQHAWRKQTDCLRDRHQPARSDDQTTRTLEDHHAHLQRYRQRNQGSHRHRLRRHRRGRGKDRRKSHRTGEQKRRMVGRAQRSAPGRHLHRGRLRGKLDRQHDGRKQTDDLRGRHDRAVREVPHRPGREVESDDAHLHGRRRRNEARNRQGLRRRQGQSGQPRGGSHGLRAEPQMVRDDLQTAGGRQIHGGRLRGKLDWKRHRRKRSGFV